MTANELINKMAEGYNLIWWGPVVYLMPEGSVKPTHGNTGEIFKVYNKAPNFLNSLITSGKLVVKEQTRGYNIYTVA